MTVEFSTHITGALHIVDPEPTATGMFFPAGEAHVKVADGVSDGRNVTEVARISGADGGDLMMLAMWADAIHRTSPHARTVVLIPYLPGARQDRGIPFGSAVYARALNRLGVDQLVAFDPHSPVMPAMIENLTVVESTRLIRREVVNRADRDVQPQRYDGLICPDAGARGRTQLVADALHLPVFHAEKHRDESTGQLSGFTCDPLPETGRFLVVDDICDGGGTFIGLAEATGLPRERLGLYVSHGVFSKPLDDLFDHYSEIHTTDSFPHQNTDPRLHTIPLAPYLFGALA